MEITLLGYGKMGKAVEASALSRGHTIVEKLDSTPDRLKECDLIIDFSTGEAVKQNVTLAAEAKKNIVIGTTGWYHQLNEIREIVEQQKIALLYAPNFSIGVNLFYSMVEHAAQLMTHFPQYDLSAAETHHNQKADSPSGTAKAIGEILLNHFPQKKSLVTELGNRPIREDEIHLSTTRIGHVPGTHSLFFDSAEDSITLTHRARNRNGFAEGAVLASEWIAGKSGMYTLKDLIEDQLTKTMVTL